MANQAASTDVMAWDRPSFVGELLPGLPNELAMRCLARIPVAKQAEYRQVSKAWRDALLSDNIFALRRILHVSEDVCAYVLTSTRLRDCDKKLYKVSIHSFRFQELSPDVPPSSLASLDQSYVYEFLNDSRLIVFLGYFRNPGVEESKLYMISVGLYSPDLNQWVPAPPMLTSRRLYSFAKGSLGDSIYVAGGDLLHKHQNGALRSAEVFNARTNRWEALPDMHMSRVWCSGFVMDGRFYVAGGFSRNYSIYSAALTCAEFYDPGTNTWTLLPDFLPPASPFAHQSQPQPSDMAVLQNELYALDSKCCLIQHYDKQTNTWSSMGKVPNIPNYNLRNQATYFVAVGEELWVVGAWVPCLVCGLSPVRWASEGYIEACKPDVASGTAVWRRIRVPAHISKRRVDGFVIVQG